MSVLEAFKLSKDHVCLTGGSRAVCPTQTIKVVEGENVTLHCGLDPPVNLSRYTVDWTRVDNQHFVYVYRHGREDPGSVADQYRGRTTINHEALSRGILTLKISSANLSDSGSYKCFVPELEVCCEVHLIVEKETKTDVSNTTGPAVEEVTETDDGASKDQQNRTKTDVSSTTVPADCGAAKRTAVWKIVLPVVGGVLVLVAAFLLWRCGVIEKCMQMLKGERQQEYEGPRDIELQ
ncbi:selection and upkeep of intraepithelial T-cells protein 4-like isoform X2 [Anarhichas minor]|uniref:selection and upkeep of intraepithelial T-cells protein 4-like isoform X2 n=1 Tax=Anarhichas minor TaxID=65739 RepID=UPI003F73C6EE